MSLTGSILKEILQSKECSVGKYLSPMFCNDERGVMIEYYITPVVTKSKSDILIISKIVNGNWYEALLNIENIVKSIKDHYNLITDEYTVILHAYFDVVELENFYVVDVKDKYMLHKLKLSEFEKILSN